MNSPISRLRGTLPRWAILAGGCLLVGAGSVAIDRRLHAVKAPEATTTSPTSSPVPVEEVAKGPAAEPRPAVIRMDEASQKAVVLATEAVTNGPEYRVLTAPGKVQPDESRYAFITPRAHGVVRDVRAMIGQEVHAGDLLATLDSPEVAQARLDLITRMQNLEIAKAQADWQESVLAGTLELIERLKHGDSPEAVHQRFQGRAVGQNRQSLMTGYSQYRLQKAALDRFRGLQERGATPLSQYQRVEADFEAAQATYQALMDQMGVESKLARDRANQARRLAETDVRVVRGRLRVLGVSPDVREFLTDTGEIANPVPVDLQGRPILAPSIRNAEPDEIEQNSETSPAGVATEGTSPSGRQPFSTYPLRAPFDGTILDREMIVPGIPVDITRHIFVLADLSSVWVEAAIHESNFEMLAGTRGGQVELRSPAYPERTFQGEVFYTGDLVDEKSRSVKLLCRAKNPDRLLKPGMFVDVTIRSRTGKTTPHVAASAVLTDGPESLVYVKTAPDRFERRTIVVGPLDGDHVAVERGLTPGDEVVVHGAFKLKAEAARLAETD